jgi:hypothetical protein
MQVCNNFLLWRQNTLESKIIAYNSQTNFYLLFSDGTLPKIWGLKFVGEVEIYTWAVGVFSFGLYQVLELTGCTDPCPENQGNF